MSLKRIATTLGILNGAVVVFFGLNFLLNPHGAAAGYGIDPWPQGNAAGYFVVKAVRDIACGLVVFVLLALGQRRALGWVLLVNALIPLGDATAVLTHGGTPAIAYGIHGVAAAVVLVTAGLFLAETHLSTGRAPESPVQRVS